MKNIRAIGFKLPNLYLIGILHNVHRDGKESTLTEYYNLLISDKIKKIMDRRRGSLSFKFDKEIRKELENH